MVNNSVVAVLDIGSNSIKILVARRADDGSIATLAAKTLDARISAGISRTQPRLTDESMTRGLAAVRELLALAAPFAPGQTIVVATSAVRDAVNGTDFRAHVQAVTGHSLRILSGDEEANLIGRGLTCDPALSALRDFYVFDLGGGSLECLAFRDRRIAQAVSLQLGCVRLTEKLIVDAAQPIPSTELAAVAAHTQSVLAGAAFSFSLPAGATIVGTGGTLTTARAILAARAGRPLETTDSRLAVAAMRQLLGELAPLPLTARRAVPGLPAARADVFPTALATLIAVAEAGGFSAYQHSFYNLRYGLAAEALDR